MRTVWAVLAVLVVAAGATVAISVGVPPSAVKLPGPITVRAPPARGGPLSATSSGASLRSLGGEDEPVRVVTPDRPVSSLPAPIGSDSREAEQPKPGARLPSSSPSRSTATDR